MTRPIVSVGEIIEEEFLKPHGLTMNTLAKGLRMQYPQVINVVSHRGRVKPEMALRLARLFGTTPELWMQLQLQYDLNAGKVRASERVNQEVTPLPASSDLAKIIEELEVEQKTG